MKDHFILTRVAILKKILRNVEDMEKLEHSYITNRNAK